MGFSELGRKRKRQGKDEKVSSAGDFRLDKG
jgi:hypothetical protein